MLRELNGGIHPLAVLPIPKSGRMKKKEKEAVEKKLEMMQNQGDDAGNIAFEKHQPNLTRFGILCHDVTFLLQTCEALIVYNNKVRHIFSVF